MSGIQTMTDSSCHSFSFPCVVAGCFSAERGRGECVCLPVSVV